MFLGRSIDHGVEKKCPRWKIDNGRAENAERADRTARQSGRYGRAHVALPDYGAGKRVKRINIVRLGHRDHHRLAARPVFDVKGLGKYVADNRAVKVRVARQIGCVSGREYGIDVETISRKMIVMLSDVDRSICRENRTKNGNAQTKNENGKLTFHAPTFNPVATFFYHNSLPIFKQYPHQIPILSMLVKTDMMHLFNR